MSRVFSLVAGLLPVSFAAAPASLQASGPQFGRTVACADLDGDGYDDVIVGEPYHSGTLVEQGRVLVYPGSPLGPETTPSWIHLGPQARSHFGAALVAAGDLNGDGHEDVVVGMPDFDVLRIVHVSGPGAAASLQPRVDAGAVAFFMGTPLGLTSSPTHFHFGTVRAEHMGISVARGGDVDADALADVIVGATGTAGNRGAALLFRGATGGIGLPASVVIGPQANARYGSAVGGGGDLDDDGFDDVLVGAPDGGTEQDGAAYVYRGSASGIGPEPSATWTRFDILAGEFGSAVTIAKGLSWDGLHDFAVVGDPGATFYGVHITSDNAGCVTLFSGIADSSSGFGIFAHHLNPYEFGRTVSRTCDLDANGLPEAMGGGPGSYGMVFDIRDKYFVNTSPLRGLPTGCGFGSAVDVGDVDGDGIDDLVVGEPRFDGVVLDQGRVTVLEGNPGFFSAPTGTTRWSLSAP